MEFIERVRFRNDTPLLNKILIKIKNSELTIQRGKETRTVDKKSIYICNKTIPNVNFLFHILIHELSHVLCNEEHHTLSFFKILDQLEKECVYFYDKSKVIPSEISNYCYSCNC